MPGLIVGNYKFAPKLLSELLSSNSPLKADQIQVRPYQIRVGPKDIVSFQLHCLRLLFCAQGYMFDILAKQTLPQTIRLHSLISFHLLALPCPSRSLRNSQHFKTTAFGDDHVHPLC